jgi:hypothetical protein
MRRKFHYSLSLSLEKYLVRSGDHKEARLLVFSSLLLPRPTQTLKQIKEDMKLSYLLPHIFQTDCVKALCQIISTNMNIDLMEGRE